MKAFMAGLVIVSIIILDLTSTILFTFLFDTTQADLYLNPLHWLFLTFVSKTFLFTWSYLFKRIYKNKEQNSEINRLVWCMVLFIPAFTILNLNISIEAVVNADEVPISIFFNAIGLFYIHVILVFLLEKITIEQRAITENIWYKKEINSRMHEMKIWMDALDRQKIIAHDVNHHFSLLNQLLNNNQVEEAKFHLEKVSISIADRQVVDTNNPIINAIVNQKYWVAKQKGIGMVFKINNLEKFPIRSEELVTILSNLLDNAIEATEKVMGVKSIVVKIMIEEGVAVLAVRNTSNPVIIYKNSIETSKEDSLEHGFGLKSVMNSLDEYNFSYAMQYQDGWFTFSAVSL
ncbi:MAG: GHKL domain-containing protein [Eubacteriales bacterium]